MATRFLAEGFLLFILGGAVVLFYSFIFKKVNEADKESKTKESKQMGVNNDRLVGK